MHYHPADVKALILLLKKMLNEPVPVVIDEVVYTESKADEHMYAVRAELTKSFGAYLATRELKK